MTCTHCVLAVSDAVSAVPGVLGVAVDLATAKVQIQGEPNPSAVRAAIEEEGYSVR
jgi:copper chaperone